MNRHDHDHGLEHDLHRLLGIANSRRRALRWLGGAGALALVGCGGGEDDAASSSSGSGSSDGGSAGSGSSSGTAPTCSVIPEETAGPYPGDGSNTSGGSIANALTLSGIVRSDIRASVAGASGVAQGVPMSVVIDLVNTNASCADLSGYAIYLWHCDAAGRYSMYSSGVTAENYLRGVQATGSDGTATFSTIVPGCYSGRMPHMHFEVYRSTGTASQYTNKLRTSQIAFPIDICSAVYNGSSLYSASVANLARFSFATDNVFSDGVTTQLATVTGDLANGYVARLQVGIAA
ncbi:MAG: intradiol ring-cleavage dioxygenase [Rubrivivax sp.]|nr:intradiol ring-cleavage dioxygenase [Rubrivivax sp.]